MKDFDEIISPSDTDFAGSGVTSESLIRLGLLAVLPRTRILGSIGAVSVDRRRRLLKRLSDYLVKQSS